MICVAVDAVGLAEIVKNLSNNSNIHNNNTIIFKFTQDIDMSNVQRNVYLNHDYQRFKIYRCLKP